MFAIKIVIKVKKQLKPAYRNYFGKIQSSGDDQESLEKACRARGGVWNREEQLCYGIKDGKKKPIGEKN